MGSVLATIASIIVSTAMATVALLRYRRHELGWLFLAVIATRVVLSLGNIVRLIAPSPNVAITTEYLRWIMLWLASLSILLFFGALYTPQLRKRKLLVGVVIGLYTLTALIIAVDGVAGTQLFIITATLTNGQYINLGYGPFGWPMVYIFNASWVLQLAILGYAFAKQPQERVPLLVLLGSLIVSGSLGGLGRLVPVIAIIAPSVGDVLFVGAMAYLLFRRRVFQTTRVAIELALQDIPQGIAVISLDGTVLWTNPTATRLIGVHVGQMYTDSTLPIHKQQAIRETLALDGADYTVQISPYALVLSSTPIRDQQGHVQGFLLLVRDVTAVHAAERALHERQRELEHTVGALQDAYAAQQQLIEQVRVLSMPIIPVLDGVIVVPLIGTIDGQWRAAFTNRLLEGIEQHRARLALLDLTGLSTLDQEAADAVAHGVQSARLLGASVMLIGVRPETAHALVMFNLELSIVGTAPTLASALTSQLTTAASQGRRVLPV
jgi:rsbT co-antagonist protein RsbR